MEYLAYIIKRHNKMCCQTEQLAWTNTTADHLLYFLLKKNKQSVLQNKIPTFYTDRNKLSYSPAEETRIKMFQPWIKTKPGNLIATFEWLISKEQLNNFLPRKEVYIGMFRGLWKYNETLYWWVYNTTQLLWCILIYWHKTKQYLITWHLFLKL